MQTSIEALHREVTDLKSKLMNLATDPGLQKPTYARVTSSSKNPAVSKNVQHDQQPSLRGNRVKQSHNTQQPNPHNAGLQKDRREGKSKVLGVRRIWGAVRSCTVSAISNTLKKLTTVGSQLTVRRRSRFDGRSGKSYYWFILKGNEDVLCELEGEWDRVNLQTEWKLESCYYSTGRDDQQQQSAKQSTTSQNQNTPSGTLSPVLPLIDQSNTIANTSESAGDLHNPSGSSSDANIACTTETGKENPSVSQQSVQQSLETATDTSGAHFREKQQHQATT